MTSAVIDLLVKLLVSAGMVLAIIGLAERVSVRLAGVLMGFPLGAGLSILFFGLEQGPRFAAESARWGIQGVLACLTFAFCYVQALKFFGQKSSRSIVFCVLIACMGFFMAALLLRLAAVEQLWLEMGVTLLGMSGFALLFRSFPLRPITRKVPATAAVLGLRALFSAVVVLAITSAAFIVGPEWSGLFSTFPVTILPTVVILHHKYGADTVFTLFRELPFGLVAIIVFDLTVSYSFPTFGVWKGLLLAYGVALLYVPIYELKIRRALTLRFFPRLSS